jgi:hypothetical protein
MYISSFKAGFSKPRKAPSVFISNDNRTIRIRGMQITMVLSTDPKYTDQVDIPLTAMDKVEPRTLSMDELVSRLNSAQLASLLAMFFPAMLLSFLQGHERHFCSEGQ